MSTPENKKSDTVVTRMAPSPTGYLHIGGAKTGLFNYLFAKHHGGRFILRIEDTDKERSKPEYETPIVEGFAWLGVVADAFYRQSEHVARHRECLERLVATDAAYVSREPKKDNPDEVVEVVRLRNPGTRITFTDHIRGEVSFDTTELGDFVIARSMNDPLYHLAVVIDDHDEGVTHVIRAEEHLSNTPRQILLHHALGFRLPEYAHLPLMLAPDRSKLSKRKGVVAVTAYRDEGYIPEAMVNYLAMQGWNPGTEQELFSMDELVKSFTLEGVQKSGAVFDVEKLNWFNREHRKRLPRETILKDVVKRLEKHPRLAEQFAHTPEAMDDALERFSTYGELVRAVEAGEFAFYEHKPVYDALLLHWKKDPDPAHTASRLTEVYATLGSVEAGEWHRTGLEAALMPLAEREGKGNVLWPLRVALSGRERSPDPFLLSLALGKDETLERIRDALEKIA